MDLAHNIQQEEIIAGIYNRLIVSDGLVGMLAKSAPINNHDGALARKNSIIPMSKIPDETGTRPVPLLGIRSGNMSRVGNHTYDVFVFIRCYTSLDKTFVETNEIMSYVNNLLDRQYIDLKSAVTAQMRLEQLTGEEYDEGYKLNYREGQFRLTLM